MGRLFKFENYVQKFCQKNWFEMRASLFPRAILKSKIFIIQKNGDYF